MTDEVKMLRELVSEMLDNTVIPEKNCSCHINAPCSDCVEHDWARQWAGKAKYWLQRAPDVDANSVAELAHKKGKVLGFCFKEPDGELAVFDSGLTIQYAMDYLNCMPD